MIVVDKVAHARGNVNGLSTGTDASSGTGPTGSQRRYSNIEGVSSSEFQVHDVRITSTGASTGTGPSTGTGATGSQRSYFHTEGVPSSEFQVHDVGVTST
jgi:hypothetical protein